MDPALHQQTSSGLQRISSLDSIRGFASLAVLLGHSLAACNWDRGFCAIFLVHNAFDGRSAVTMFFVLSGFVLSLRHAHDRTRKVPIGSFYVRRITRIWIPWFAFFLLSLAAWSLRPPLPAVVAPPLTDHHLMFWSSSFIFQDLLWQLVFRLHDASRMMLPQDWSLGVELRASIFIPFLIFAARHRSIFCLLLGGGIWLLKPAGGYYYASFALGTFTAFAHVSLARHCNAAWIGLACVVGGLLLYQIRWVCSFTGWLPEFLGEKDVWMISAAGCALLILGCLRHAPMRALLDHPACAWLGRISYSLYLVQVIVLVCLGPWVVRLLNLAGMGAESPLLPPLFVVSMVAVCLPLAALGERFIEIPAIRLGRVATDWLEKTRFGKLAL